MSVFYCELASPVGRLLLIGDEAGLRGVSMEGQRGAPSIDPSWREDPSRLARAADQLGEYFAGTRTRFDLPLSLEGTSFQRAVWAALCRVPYGATTTYGELARAVARPGAARAVGAANARNPVSIIVPCHRVIGASGALVGYAGGEARKRWLLERESGGARNWAASA